MEESLMFLLLVATTKANPLLRAIKSKEYDEDHQKICSNLLQFNNMIYALDERINITGIPADMTFHWKSGNAYFTLISEEMKMGLTILKPDGQMEAIKVNGLGQSTAVDNLNDVIYLGTDNGVYRFETDGVLEQYAAVGEDVMYLAVSNDGTAMYIATWPQNRVHKITNGGQNMEPFPIIPNGHGLTIDPKNNIYFIASKTSYILKNGDIIPMKIKGLPTDKMTGISVSRSDDVYAMDEFSNLYSIDPVNVVARHLGTFSVLGVNSFAIDASDNIVLGIQGSFLKYKYFEKNPCEDFTKQPAEVKESAKKATKKPRGSSKRKSRKTTTTTTEEGEDYEDEESTTSSSIPDTSA